MSRPFPIVEARSRYLQHTGEYLPNGELHVVGASGAMKGIESQIQPTVYLEAGREMNIVSSIKFSRCWAGYSPSKIVRSAPYRVDDTNFRSRSGSHRRRR